MKSRKRHLVVLSLAAVLLVGCSGDNVDQPPPPESPGNGGQLPPDPDPKPPSEPPEDVRREPEPGDPGSIKGVVKSPYAMLYEGAVFIVRVDGPEFPPPKENSVMDQKNLIFLPHLLPILVGTSVDFPNSDTVRHNVFTTKGSIQDFNLGTYDVGVVKQITFDKVGVTHLGCNVHTEMSAYIVACQNPYFAVTEKGRGNFVIPEVPPGKWQLRLFHEKLKEKTIEVVVKPGEETTVEFTNLERK